MKKNNCLTRDFTVGHYEKGIFSLIQTFLMAVYIIDWGVHFAIDSH